MTSFGTLIERVPRTRHDAGPGSRLPRNEAERFELEWIRRMGGAARMAAFDEIQTLMEVFGIPTPSRKPVLHGPMRL